MAFTNQLLSSHYEWTTGIDALQQLPLRAVSSQQWPLKNVNLQQSPLPVNLFIAMVSTGQLLYSSDLFLPATLLHFSLHAKLPATLQQCPLLVSYSTSVTSIGQLLES